MRTTDSSLVNYLLNNGGYYLADLYKITLLTGTTLRWTDASAGINAPSGFYSVGPVIERGPISLQLGFEVDTLDVTLKGPDVVVSGTQLCQAALNGVFDGATVEVRRIVMPSFGSSPFTDPLLFSGRVSTVEPSSSAVRLSIKSDLELLNVPMPKNVYQPQCGRTLYDSGCGVPRANYVKTAAVTGGSKTSFSTTLTDPAGWFDMGVVTFTSGPNLGVQRTIKSYSGGTIQVVLPLPFNASGNITVVPGCDRTQGTCFTKFNNIAAFRGFPFVPKPESAR